MMMKRSLLLGCISLFVVAVFAQEDPVIRLILYHPVYRIHPGFFFFQMTGSHRLR